MWRVLKILFIVALFCVSLWVICLLVRGTLARAFLGTLVALSCAGLVEAFILRDKLGAFKVLKRDDPEKFDDDWP